MADYEKFNIPFNTRIPIEDFIICYENFKYTYFIFTDEYKLDLAKEISYFLQDQIYLYIEGSGNITDEQNVENVIEYTKIRYVIKRLELLVKNGKR